MKRVTIDKKGSREIKGRASRPKKRPKPLNRHMIECETASTSASAKKLKTSSVIVPIDASHGYRIINFLTLFSTLSDMIKCKSCDGDISFKEGSIRGLGFKLVITCDKCEPRYINCCPLINHAYEINRRFVFAMRLLGVGYEGAKKFCGIMDLPNIFSKKVYYEILTNIYCATKTMADIIFSEAVVEEKRLTTNAKGTEPAGLTISGDGTWMKRGFSSLHGVVTLIGHYSGQVIDVNIKSLYCKQCEYSSQNLDTEEYETWEESHRNKCSIDHKESTEKMEVDGAIEMFARSEDLHGVKYLSYIDHGDNKMFKDIVESQPYGEDVRIIKKDCFTQNNNESINTLIWSIAPKRIFSGKKIVEIATYIAANIFNKGYTSILLMMATLNLTIGTNAATICEQLDATRVSQRHECSNEAKTFAASKEDRIERRRNRASLMDEQQHPFYETEMDD
ncbi:uncharacterized protein [Mycetomoellerius zeteki]|uniref:uncharacterized protein n=1 Tax=Mycetomoellerius zeteki TaxID=64791 RepID=UPI00084EA1E7|nr:PREDICTED: uncharacterized protein LOC108730504 [Trachymyrmex zeteki]